MLMIHQSQTATSYLRYGIPVGFKMKMGLEFYLESNRIHDLFSAKKNHLIRLSTIVHHLILCDCLSLALNLPISWHCMCLTSGKRKFIQIQVKVNLAVDIDWGEVKCRNGKHMLFVHQNHNHKMRTEMNTTNSSFSEEGFHANLATKMQLCWSYILRFRLYDISNKQVLYIWFWCWYTGTALLLHF